MDEEHLHDELRVFKDRSFFQLKLRSFFTVYLLLALSFLLITVLFAVSISKVSAVSSQLHKVHLEQKTNYSSTDYLLFPCGPGSREWEYFDKKCYYFSLGRTTWHKAKAACEEMHSHLAIIDSYAKQSFVMFRTRNERFWIGLTDENSEGEWEWIDGTDYKSTFTFWKEGEPNDSSNEDCAHLWGLGQWNDVYCSYECYYICEKPVPA
ncbi:hepatic lectin-like [Nothoprocta perdicaria]|uniref:hepatic lectin-like n=1 Tax=Nothoprocta perdicaria TaxID=30464 RepID=UPI000E1B7553|nr:hepatic lectin-like [Nothoprocta perdicaria]